MRGSGNTRRGGSKPVPELSWHNAPVHRGKIGFDRMKTFVQRGRVQSCEDSDNSHVERSIRFSPESPAPMWKLCLRLLSELHLKASNRARRGVICAGIFLSFACLWTAKRLGVHTVGGTWLARIRAVLAVGHARTSQLTGQQGSKTSPFCTQNQTGVVLLLSSSLRGQRARLYFFVGGLLFVLCFFLPFNGV